MAADGSSLTVLDADGRTVRTLGAGTGLIAATRNGEFAPAWVVTGTDAAGLEAAAQAFDEASLDGRFAVAVTSAGALALPAPAQGAAQ
jgi:predicted RNA methylase